MWIIVYIWSDIVKRSQEGRIKLFALYKFELD